MFVNLTDVLTNEGKVVTMQAETELEQIKISGTVFPVKDKTPVELTFTNIGKGKARITGDAKDTLSMNCDRCLKSVDKTLALQFDREVFAPDMIETIPDEAEEKEFMDGYQLDVEAFIHNEILVNWPAKILCRDDCKGICPKCNGR